MASREPMSGWRVRPTPGEGPLDGFADIPDPVGRIAPAPAPPSVLPSAPSPTRAERRSRLRAAVVLAIAWLAITLRLFGVRADIGSASAALPIAAWFVGGVALLALILRPRARGLPVGVRVVQHALWIIPAAYMIGIAIVSAMGDAPLVPSSTAACLVLSVVMTLGPLLAAALSLRGAFLSAPGWRGAAVGALAGLAGSIGVSAHCPAQSFDHLVTAHGAVIAIGAAVGALLGRAGGRP